MSEPKDDLLAGVLGEHPELVEPARRIFEYARFLLDDDEKLTKTGALTGEARELLRARILELVDPAGRAGPAAAGGAAEEGGEGARQGDAGES